MGILFSFMAWVIVISFLSAVIWGLSFLYIKIAKKRDLSSSHKKWGVVSLVIFLVSTSVFFLSPMSQESENATDTKAKVHKSLSKNKKHEDTYKLDTVTNIETSYDSEMEGNQVITGQTSAPDGSTILISDSNIPEMNLAKTSDVNLVRVKNGHFKAYVNSIYSLLGSKAELGEKINLNIIAVEKYDRSLDQATDKMLNKNQLKDIVPTEITLSDQVVKYYNSLGDKDSKSDSSNDSDESISSSTKDNSNKNTEFNINSYRTDITYEQLARTPDEFENDKLTMTGQVVQVMEDDDNDTSNLRVAIDGNFDNIVVVGVKNSNLNNSHILEDDLITFYGTSKNLISYDSTLSGQITVPAVRADQIDDKGKAPDDYSLN
ncbi:hypothetical protein ff3pr_02267 [Weissella cibaria]|uniref:hypothetical protein n=1 Tax=Weissella cibaria TaxID=137591 RepID=UPI0005C2E945|nr:hypothetical protein [Weissella cibaria]KIU20085.1 hypothetical protein ff3pr_02267 [Weissella cibaria]